MTDYLTRLAGRLHPAHQVLRPALPSRFALAKTAMGVELELNSQETACRFTNVQRKSGTGLAIAPELGRRAAVFEPSLLKATTPVAQLKEDERSGRAWPAAGAARAPETDEPAIEQKRVLERPHTAVSPHAVEPAPVGREMQPPPAENRKDSSSPTDLMRGIEEREQEHPAIRRSSSPGQAARRGGGLVSQPTAHSEAREDDVRPLASPRHPSPPGTLQPRTEVPPQESLPMGRTVVLGPKLPSRHPPDLSLLAATGKQHPREAGLSAAPEIRVTIGRIEVRAITPAAPSVQKEQSPHAPRLSLDAYLRSRNGGTA